MALCDDHTPHATSLVAFCKSLTNFHLNSNFDIAVALTEESSAFFIIWASLTITVDFTAKFVFLKIELQNPTLNRVKYFSDIWLKPALFKGYWTVIQGIDNIWKTALFWTTLFKITSFRTIRIIQDCVIKGIHVVVCLWFSNFF